jgi:hypothetical protein
LSFQLTGFSEVLLDVVPLGITTCQTLIEAKASLLTGSLGSATSGYVSDTNWGTVHKTYQSGAIYCHDVNGGAHAVYGLIYQKWKAQNGNYGYPITDETGTTDLAGNAIRFNIFAQGTATMAIYWTPAHGACMIHGDIYGRWLSIGDVKSSIGYPITDETGSGSSGGRYNDFSNGMIYWNSGNSWVHDGPVPDSVTLNQTPLNWGSSDMTGSNSITLDINGDVRWVSNIHTPTGNSYIWELGLILVDADLTAISLYQTGEVWGSSGDNNLDIISYGNAVIANNWRAWVISDYRLYRDDFSLWDNGSGSVNEDSLFFTLLQDVQADYPSVKDVTVALVFKP